LHDGVSIFEALSSMDTHTFDKGQIKYDESDSYQAYSNFKKIVGGLKQFYEQMHGADENGDKESPSDAS